MDINLITIHNTCWRNVACLHQINNHVNHGGALSKLIWWIFFAIVIATWYIQHVLFHEQSKPFSYNIKPSTSRFDEFKSNGLYHTFEDGLSNSC
jgi:hypothetical protein